MRCGLYAIVDLDALGGRDPVRFADALLAAGPLFAIQLRAKGRPARDVLHLARSMARQCARASVPFVVNDRPDIAVLSGATGVHVGQDDLPVDEVRRIAPEHRIGVSTHDAAQFARSIALKPGYIAFGPVFATSSKRHPDAVVGVAGLREAVAVAGDVPVVAIGGITLERARVVREAGASAGAVIAALCEVSDADVTTRARALHVALGGQ